MTDKVQWKTLPTKANRDMEQAGADAAREYLQRTGHNNLWVIYEAMVGAAPKPPTEQHQGESVAWSAVKPVSPGAYWIRGNGLDQDALVQVINDDGELRCNLHQRTTETDFGYGYAVSDLSSEFEWLGPLCMQKLAALSASAEPSTPVECAICRELGDQCLECEEADFITWADRHFASADYKKTDSGVYIQDWMRHAFAAWQARGALEHKS